MKLDDIFIIPSGFVIERSENKRYFYPRFWGKWLGFNRSYRTAHYRKDAIKACWRHYKASDHDIIL